MSSNRPDTIELVESVREMLETELLPSLKDNTQVYNSRVAVNVLRIVERELKQIDAQEEAEVESLCQLLDAVGDLEALNSLLVKKIHQGEFDDENGKLMAHFQQTILGRIAIDNPRYSTYKKFMESGELVCH